MNDHERRPRPSPQVVARTIDGETVIIDPERNIVRMLNEVGSRIWELADGSRTAEEIADALTVEFEVEQDEARATVRDFLNELQTRCILEH